MHADRKSGSVRTRRLRYFVNFIQADFVRCGGVIYENLTDNLIDKEANDQLETTRIIPEIHYNNELRKLLKL